MSSLSSFKEAALKKLDAIQTPASSKQKEKETRKRVNPYSAIVTSDEQFQAAWEGEQKKRAKEAAKEAAKAKREAKTKQKKVAEQLNDDSDSDVDDDIELAQLLNNDSNGSENESADEDNLRPNHIEQPVFPPKNESEGYKYLSNVCAKINLDKKECL